LKHHLDDLREFGTRDVSLDRDPRVRCCFGDPLAFEAYGALGRIEEAGDAVRESRFAGAALSDDGD